MSSSDVAIIGAGPGGTCCAAMLERLGIDSLIIERSTFPRFTIGESLLPVTLGHLEDAGLLEAVHDAGFQNKPGVVFHDGAGEARIDFTDSEGLRHSHAFNLRRDRFDDVLARAVTDRGVDIHWGTTVTDATFADRKWELSVDSAAGPSKLEARFVVDASGAAVIARLAGVEFPQPPSQTRGSVFCHLEDPRRPDGFAAGAIWILSNDTAAWGWIIPFADGTASVGFVGDQELIEAAGDTAAEQFETLRSSFEAAHRRFDGQEFVRIEPRTIFGYRRPPIHPFGPGYCLVGNSIGFLDPVFSSGVAIATESAIRAAHAVASHFGNDEFDWEERYAEPLMRGIGVLEACAESWYDRALYDLIYAESDDLPFRAEIISILAGGAWDDENPLTTDTAATLRHFRRKLLQRRRLGL